MKQAVIRCCCFVWLFVGNNAWGVPKRWTRSPRPQSVEVLAAPAKPQEIVLPEKPMVIVIPSYNNEQWYQKNLRSVFDQKYQNYRVIYIDDCSPDGTADLVAKFVSTCHQGRRVTLIRNQVRRGALANLYNAIHSCNDNDIIVTLDGDDELAHSCVLRKLNFVYSTDHVWMTHGKLRELRRGNDTWCIPVPQDIIEKNRFRTFRCPSHLRTFYAWLFKKIRFEDLQYEGAFFKMTWDQAIMFPMIEMAGNRHKFIEEVNYIYNDLTPLNDNKVNPQLQRDLEVIIRSKPAYMRLPEDFVNQSTHTSKANGPGFMYLFKHYKVKGIK